jgi:hypothetical protein
MSVSVSERKHVGTAQGHAPERQLAIIAISTD